MQPNHALKVALKDRPRIFQVIVVFLFWFSVLTVVVCAVFSLQESRKATGVTTQNEKHAFNPNVYASFSATGH